VIWKPVRMRPDPGPIPPPPSDPPACSADFIAVARRAEVDLLVDFQKRIGLEPSHELRPMVAAWEAESIAKLRAWIDRELLTVAGHIVATTDGCRVDAVSVKGFLAGWPHYVGLCLLGEGRRSAMRKAFGRIWPPPGPAPEAKP
jgi:hypothetical protein